MGGAESKEPDENAQSHSGDQYVGGQEYGQSWSGYAGYGSQYTPPGYSAPDIEHPAKAASSRSNIRPMIDNRYSRIGDQYNTIEEVTDSLAHAGLESSNLIVGIDFTKSNEWTGKTSFNGLCLHHIGDAQNPYEQAISIIGRTLSKFDEDDLIPCFGFGDASTHDQNVFCFYHDERPCNGFSEALARYKELVPHVKLAGPTSFAPIIEKSMNIVEESGGQYHVLLIIADGQVTRSINTAMGQLSRQEQETLSAIIRASELPLSIVLVGVGDGPWDVMREFDDNIPARAFDNFQFVNFTEVMSRNLAPSKKEASFALAALMEIPSQYKATIELGILGRRSAKSHQRVALPPPQDSYSAYTKGIQSSEPGFQHVSPLYTMNMTAPNVDPSAESNLLDNQCPICLTNPKNMAFGCGHQTCQGCGNVLEKCPICRSPIGIKIKLY